MVSLCLKKTKTYYFTESLPKNKQISENGLPIIQHKGIPLCACLKASYTLEAAVIIPLVVGFWMCIMLFFRLLQVQTAMTEALDYAGKMVAVESSTVSSNAGLLASAEGFLNYELKDYELVDQYIEGGKLGVSLLQSKITDQYVELVADYRVKLPVRLFNIGAIFLEQRSYHRRWTGKALEEKDDPYVYYTPTGSVYHLTNTCTYLDLSIKSVKYAEIAHLRNKNAHKYSACRCKAEDITAESIVYVTDYGTKYHSSLQCSSLKRTVYMVHLSEVGTRRLCSKCKLQSEVE